jgi:hypothetical protein
MNPKYLVVASWNGKVKNHCGAANPAEVVVHFTDACKGLFDRYPSQEEIKNGFAAEDDCSVQVLCLDKSGVLVEEDSELFSESVK